MTEMVRRDGLEVEELEIDLLLEAIHRRYGYDFRDYARASLRRKVRQLASTVGVRHVSELVPRLLHEPELFGSVVGAFATPVTEMFRDPLFFKYLREVIVPYLKTWPFVRIWVAGCATGEEVYSLAILLREEGISERCTLFATDFVDPVLRNAREGIFPLRSMKTNIANYRRAGGRETLSDYYHADYDSVIMEAELRKNITFANHNLVTDGVFSEVHLILCRNVLIYFNRALQNRVLELFHASLLHGGFLALGSKESLHSSDSRESSRNWSRRGRSTAKPNEGAGRRAPGPLRRRGARRLRRGHQRGDRHRLGAPRDLSAAAGGGAPSEPRPIAWLGEVSRPAGQAAGGGGRGQDAADRRTVHCAPPGYHLLVETDGTLALSVDAKVNFARPSIDLLFASAADAFGPALIGVVLTGANGDGARGLAEIAAAGSLALVQSPRTAEWPAMPEAALQAVPQALVVDLEAIAETLVRLCMQGRSLRPSLQEHGHG